MPKSVKPRTALTCGVEINADTIGYVIWSSIRSGLRPIHSVETITCTSEMSGTASSGVRVIAQTPHTVTITVPVNTRNRLDAHQSMIRSIMVEIHQGEPQRHGDTEILRGGSPCLSV